MVEAISHIVDQIHSLTAGGTIAFIVTESTEGLYVLLEDDWGCV